MSSVLIKMRVMKIRKSFPSKQKNDSFFYSKSNIPSWYSELSEKSSIKKLFPHIRGECFLHFLPSPPSTLNTFVPKKSKSQLFLTDEWMHPWTIRQCNSTSNKQWSFPDRWRENELRAIILLKLRFICPNQTPIKARTVSLILRGCFWQTRVLGQDHQQTSWWCDAVCFGLDLTRWSPSSPVSKISPESRSLCWQSETISTEKHETIQGAAAEYGILWSEMYPVEMAAEYLTFVPLLSKESKNYHELRKHGQLSKQGNVQTTIVLKAKRMAPFQVREGFFSFPFYLVCSEIFPKWKGERKVSGKWNWAIHSHICRRVTQSHRWRLICNRLSIIESRTCKSFHFVEGYKPEGKDKYFRSWLENWDLHFS